MAQKTILLACSAGMSTSLLASKMQDAATAAGKDYKVFATSTSDIDHQLEAASPDVLLLGPQVRYMAADVKQKTDAAGIPMMVIDMQDYGMMNGAKVLQSAEALIASATN
ncbi:PTS sugar transporter subunit IIB [Furfurilactobacillus curtus]|uniref:PTS sugar transporter subunit IIB n=1 Tax=Furfurilactobacillus curtus TaxID=1746200 RepID=A0ABQ5JT48_9LACO